MYKSACAPKVHQESGMYNHDTVGDVTCSAHDVIEHAKAVKVLYTGERCSWHRRRAVSKRDQGTGSVEEGVYGRKVFGARITPQVLPHVHNSSTGSDDRRKWRPPECPAFGARVRSRCPLLIRRARCNKHNRWMRSACSRTEVKKFRSLWVRQNGASGSKASSVRRQLVPRPRCSPPPQHHSNQLIMGRRVPQPLHAPSCRRLQCADNACEVNNRRTRAPVAAARSPRNSPTWRQRFKTADIRGRARRPAATGPSAESKWSANEANRRLVCPPAGQGTISCRSEASSST